MARQFDLEEIEIIVTTIKAAKIFAELGTMERSVSWDREGIPEPV